MKKSKLSELFQFSGLAIPAKKDSFFVLVDDRILAKGLSLSLGYFSSHNVEYYVFPHWWFFFWFLTAHFVDFKEFFKTIKTLRSGGAF